MATNIGASLKLDGEKEFKAALKASRDNLKLLGDQLKLLSAEYADNEGSSKKLRKEKKLLRSEVKEETEQIKLLKDRLKEASEAFGENDSRTKALRDQLVRAKTSLAETRNELKHAGDAAKEAGEKAEKSGGGWSKLGDILKGVGAAMAAAAAAAGAAAVELGKQVVSAVADAEQLTGGVETLFGADAQAVMDNAAAAFQTAGLSANAYMETVTGMSASLIQSLGGDTKKAAALADQAIIDMADNANKMGSDMESIQNAYAGFAKGNYTMLDNLKLGYGGTKEEMARLLADATALSGVEYDISSYADIVEAIHTVQTEMGITGTTAKEATETISGSVSAFSSAWQNLLAGLGSGEADVGQLVSYLVEAGKTVLDNVVPVIVQLVEAIPGALEAVSAALVAELPGLLDTAVGLFESVLAALLALLPQLIPVTVDAVILIFKTLIENLPLLIDGGIQLITSLALGIGNALPELIPAIVEAIITICTALVDNIPMLIDAALLLIMGLADGLIAALPELIDAAPELIEGLVDGLVDNLPKILGVAAELVAAIVTGIVENLPQLLEGAAQIIFKIVEGLADGLKELVRKGREIVDSVKIGFDEKVQNAKTWGKDLISNFVDGIKEKWDALKKTVSGVAGSIKSLLGFSEPEEGPLSDFHTYAPDMMDLFIKGIRDRTPALEAQISKSFDLRDRLTVPALSVPRLSEAVGGTASAVANVTIPLTMDGLNLGTAIAQIQWRQGQASVRSLGRAL